MLATDAWTSFDDVLPVLFCVVIARTQQHQPSFHSNTLSAARTFPKCHTPGTFKGRRSLVTSGKKLTAESGL